MNPRDKHETIDPAAALRDALEARGKATAEIAKLERAIKDAKRRGVSLPRTIIEDAKAARAELRKGRVKLALLRALV